MSVPDCFKCKWRRSVPGSCHSSCAHPDAREALENPAANVFAALAGVGRAPALQADTGRLHVVGEPRGRMHGWFNWPWNFDPAWLQECNGFEVK